MIFILYPFFFDSFLALRILISNDDGYFAPVSLVWPNIFLLSPK